jgi:hypothetical protein
VAASSASTRRERRRLLETLVSNPRLDGGTVRFDLKKPFQILSEMREDPDWRARVEEFRTAVREAA